SNLEDDTNSHNDLDIDNNDFDDNTSDDYMSYMARGLDWQFPKLIEEQISTQRGEEGIEPQNCFHFKVKHGKRKSKEESIDSGFAKFNTIITSLKALDESFSSNNYVRKFLKALHPKWRENVMAIEESKALSSLALGELISNLKKESSDDETLTFGSDDEEYTMAVRNFKKFFRRKVSLLVNHIKRRSHFGKGMIRKERVIGNALDAVMQIISLENVQILHETKIKRRLLKVVGAIAKMKSRTKPTMKLVLWLNRQMMYA
nr:UBN2 domain-containing protein [Tanacetum cinerariifolium]